MKLLKNSLLCLLLSTPLFSSAFAEKFDIKQKIEINASRQAVDLKNKIFSYIDNVVKKKPISLKGSQQPLNKP
jgi:lipopolysaccharide export system protein LptA